MENWEILSNEISRSFHILVNSLSNTPPSLLLIFFAPLAFGLFVFFNWIKKEGEDIEDWDKFRGLLEISETQKIAPFSKVLIVDDDQSYLNLAEKVFTNMGIIVLKAYNGKEALRILNSDHMNNIDAVISDMELPDFKGTDLCLKHKHRHPFLIISGSDPKSGTLRVVDGFLSKERTREDLFEATESAIKHWVDKEKKVA